MSWRAKCRPLATLGLSATIGCALAQTGSAQSEEERPCRTDYRIQARVDVADHALHGEETILWRNESRDDVPDLWFHLYWNAFANDRSTFLLEAGGRPEREAGSRPERKDAEDEWGWQRVTSIQADGAELVGDLVWRAPEDRNEDDRTVFSVKLKKPVQSGESLAVTVRWESRIPRVRRRTGYKDDFLFVAQWFPKLGVYENGNGWNCHQFHASTEFFSDYGAYDVTLDLPAEYAGRIGASGVLAEPEQVADGRVKARFVAPSPADQAAADRTGKLPLVHDFAWTADADFVVFEKLFRFAEWTERYPDEVPRTALALGRSIDEVALRDVDVTVLVQPEHAHQAERHHEAACTALFFYGVWFGGYPYEHVTVVDPAWGGGAAGGMEYPTLFTAGTSLLATQGMHRPESVTVHECGHQFWYGLVGNNEFEAGWLDEGFNTFTQSEAMFRHYGFSQRTTEFAGVPFDGVAIAREPGGGSIADALALKRWNLPLGLRLEPLVTSELLDGWRLQPLLSFARMRNDPRAGDRNGYLADPDTDPIDTPGWRYADRTSYRTNSYRRTATSLRTLAGMVGWEPFLRGMRLYSERWRYRHPYPHDFFEAFQEGAQVDIPWFFDSVFRDTATVDWSVEVAQKRERKPSGWFQDATGAWKARAPEEEPAQEESTESIEPSAPAVADDPEPAETETKTDLGWQIEVMIRRKGALLLPVKLELRYAGGASETLLWSREEQARSTWWKPLEGRAPSKRKLTAAVLDPERVIMLDLDLSDNQWFDATDDRTPLRWSERVFTQYSHLLHGYGGIGG